MSWSTVLSHFRNYGHDAEGSKYTLLLEHGASVKNKGDKTHKNIPTSFEGIASNWLTDFNFLPPPAEPPRTVFHRDDVGGSLRFVPRA